jgi:hypothetical protein
LNDFGRNFLLGSRKKNQMFNEGFYLPLYLPLWSKGRDLRGEIRWGGIKEVFD